MVLTACPKCHHQFTLQPLQAPLAPAPLQAPLPTPALAPYSLSPSASPTPHPGACPCQAAAAATAAFGGAAPAVTASTASPAAPSTMLSLSITAASSLNGGHVVVNTTASSAQSVPQISVCATLPAPASVPTSQHLPLPWTWTQPSWGVGMPSQPPQGAAAASTVWGAPSPTTGSRPTPWAAPQTPPPPTTLKLEICPGGTLSPPQPQPPTPKGAQYRLTGGGIIRDRGSEESVLLQPRGKLGLLAYSPEHEQSPSAPLSFVLPTSGVDLPVSVPLVPVAVSMPLAAHLPAHPSAPLQPIPLPLALLEPELDLQLLQSTTQALKQSGWYYEGFSWQESAATLRNAAPGTFLVRDSSDPRFLFSLSVQTDRGPTSVRLHYIAGGFRLDAEPHLAPTMPLFSCVLQLIEHYVASSRRAKRPPPTSARGSGPGAGAAGPGPGREQVWVDARGHVYSHILLTQPRRHTVPGLQHLARLAVHRQLKTAHPTGRGLGDELANLDKLELPTTLSRYLAEYRYTL